MCIRGTRLSIRAADTYEQAHLLEVLESRPGCFESPFAGCCLCNGGPQIFNIQENLKNQEPNEQQGI